MPEELELRTPYLRLAARVWGSPDGLPVLALHGWLDNAASFDPLALLLPGLRLVALDLPGHGYSSHRPRGVHYHLVDFIPDVVAAADALGWERFAVLGHSLGAALAAFIAAVIPERVTRVALIEGLGPPLSQPTDSPRHLRKAMDQMCALPRKRLPVYPTLEAAVQVRSAASGLPWAAAKLLVERNVQQIGKGYGWRSDPRLRFVSPLYVTEAQVLAYLDRVQAPTLLICGADGYLVKRDYMQERYTHLPDLTVQTLPGGHHLHLEHPAACVRRLLPFLVADRN